MSRRLRHVREDGSFRAGRSRPDRSSPGDLATLDHADEHARGVLEVEGKGEMKTWFLRGRDGAPD
jgi:hypothetical protein